MEILDSYDTQYEDILKRIYHEGEFSFNERTAQLTTRIINVNQTYDVENNRFPLVTTRKAHWKGAIAEFLGYMRGYNNSQQFNAINCKTWDANANENPSWLENPNRKGFGDMGRAYGAQMRAFAGADGTTTDQLQMVYNKLKNRQNDRRLIITLHNPSDSHLSCLDACMWNHTFSVFQDKLYLFSNQRSNDFCLGNVFNSVQCFFFLAVMAQITGHTPGKVYHQTVDAHIYQNQMALVPQQLERVPFKTPTFHINPHIKTLEDILTWATLDDFEVKNYKHHPAISYPFSV